MGLIPAVFTKLRLTCQTKIILVRQILLLHRTGGRMKFLAFTVPKMVWSGKNLIGQTNSDVPLASGVKT